MTSWGSLRTSGIQKARRGTRDQNAAAKAESHVVSKYIHTKTVITSIVDMGLASVFLSLQKHHVLCNLTFENICQYTRLVKHLQNDILLPQPVEQTTFEQAPEILPRAIGLFLSKALCIPQKFMQDSWDILKDYIWECKKVALTKEDFELFKSHGWELGLSA